MDFNEKLKGIQEKVSNYLDNIIPCEHAYIGTILNSMRYSLMAGGKRLRPVLMIGTGEIFGCDINDLLPFCAGIEMIHTYSLIHDDLPAMDNDDYRRGKPTNHRVYGEAIAILAGDALLNYAFETMLQYALSKENTAYFKAIYEIAHSAGIYGMLGGQVVDIENENNKINEDIMKFMHNNKTGALITASVRSGAIISKAGSDELKRLTEYSKKLGLAFQVIDDILDVTGDEQKLGKNTGSDAKKNKATYVSMYGLERSRKIASELSNDALDLLQYYGESGNFLKDLTIKLLNRDC